MITFAYSKCLIYYFEVEKDDTAIFLIGAEQLRREIVMVGCVRHALALDSHTVIIMILLATLAHRGSLQPVAGIDLDCGLVGTDLNHAARLLVTEHGSQMQVAVLIAVNNPAVVIALAIVQGGEILLDVIADHLGLGKIHRRALDRRHLSTGDERVIGRQIV